jgi:hypothetical protein
MAPPAPGRGAPPATSNAARNRGDPPRARRGDRIFHVADQAAGIGTVDADVEHGGAWTDPGTLDQDSDMAFWNSYLPPTEERAGWRVEPAESQPEVSGLKSLVQSVKEETECTAIASALDQSRWNRKAAARLLKVSYRTLLYKIEQYHMTPPASQLSGYAGGSGGLRAARRRAPPIGERPRGVDRGFNRNSGGFGGNRRRF